MFHINLGEFSEGFASPLKMSEEVSLVNILQTEDWNKSELQTRESIGTKEDDKFAEIRNASRTKDKLMCVLIVVLLIGFSLVVTVVAMHLKGKYVTIT